ncbi:MAG: hypothetical protein Q9162_001817 [Coniocarpon cinnabarinum]
MGRTDFLSQPAPENYVAGLGRGATGFTTRSDLGPAREGPSEDQIKDALAKRAAQLAGGDSKEKDDENEDRYQDPENETGLFASGSFDRDDDEADRIYQDVDDRMQKRRKERREAREQKEREEFERENPKISQQFADLKRALGTVNDEDWASIPDVGDLTGKNKRVKRDNQANRRFYAVPDSVIAGANASGQYDTSIETNGTESSTNGDNADGTQTNFADIGRARDKVLQVRLDQAASGTETSTAGTSTSVDAKGYLTSLNNAAGGDFQVGDVNRVRSLLDSVTKTNPKHAPGWVAAARLEAIAGKQVAARNKIAQGCANCPNSEDCWLENISLNEKANAKIIAAEALKRNDHSTRLWIQAMELEEDIRAKKRVMRQALDHVPKSVALWKEAVNLEESEADAKLMLSKATELIPLSVELWLALARLETPENAQKVLNKARRAVPTSYEIWVAAVRLQEQTGDEIMVKKVMNRGIKALAKESAMLSREEWLTEAEKCEDEGAQLTANAIIRETLGYELEEDDDRKQIFRDDAQGCLTRNHPGTARAIYSYALDTFPTSSSLWTAAADLERDHGSREQLVETLERAVRSCDSSVKLWMQLVREKWADDVDAGRNVLATAFQKNAGSEDIWLSAISLETEHGFYDRASHLLQVARDQAGTDRVWIKSVALERTQGNRESALNLVQDGLARYPKAAKLHMMKGQIYQFDFDTPRVTQAREAYSAGTRACPQSPPLWLLSSRLEESQGLTVKARSVLERARIACSKDPSVWTESIRVERRANNNSAAANLMSRALQSVEPQRSGSLWAERIWHMAPRKERKPLALEAVKKVDNDAVLFITVARIFWTERRLDKASTWFEKALVLDSDWGDSWGWYLKFLREHGTKEKMAEVREKVSSVVPKHGEFWTAIRKDPKNARLTSQDVVEKVADVVE